MAHEYLVNAFWKTADRVGVDVELDELSRLAAELRQPAQEWQLRSLKTVVALMEGRFGQVEERLAETLDLGAVAQGWNATVSHRVALFVLRREQGRLAEIEPLVARSVHEFPALLRFRSAMANLHAELGRPREARAALDGLLARDLGNEHLDAEWLLAMNLLPDVCGFLGDAEAAARLHTLLLPYAERYAQAPLEATFGSIARGLGVLATAMARYDEAERHFEAAIELERRMAAVPWLAHARHDFAAMLLRREGPGDRGRAGELLAEARSAYRELDMDVWAERADALAGR
jgi:tetratricopeptide (TPR) repeat protein